MKKCGSCKFVEYKDNVVKPYFVGDVSFTGLFFCQLTGDYLGKTGSDFPNKVCGCFVFDDRARN